MAKMIGILSMYVSVMITPCSCSYYCHLVALLVNVAMQSSNNSGR